MARAAVFGQSGRGSLAKKPKGGFATPDRYSKKILEAASSTRTKGATVYVATCWNEQTGEDWVAVFLTEETAEAALQKIVSKAAKLTQTTYAAIDKRKVRG